MVRISDFESGDVGSNPAWLADLFEEKALFCANCSRIGLFVLTYCNFFFYFVELGIAIT